MNKLCPTDIFVLKIIKENPKIKGYQLTEVLVDTYHPNTVRKSINRLAKAKKIKKISDWKDMRSPFLLVV
jgi:hypothetical protein